MGVDFGRFGLKGSPQNPILNENAKTIKMVVVTHVIPSPGMMPPRLHEHQCSQVFSGTNGT